MSEEREIPLAVWEKIPKPFMTMWRGSIAHGMYVPNSDANSIDDKDVMSVFVDSLDHYFGLKPSFSRGTLEVKHEEWDVVCYEIRKFIQLLKQGNPNVISMLWLDRRHYIHLTALGERLIDYRWMFETKQIYHSFVGYARDQLHKMTHCAFQGYMGTKRKSLVEKFGYDTKNAAHLIRLLRMASEFLDTKQFIVERPDARELLEIKNGMWTLEQVQSEADTLFRRAEEKFKVTTLPDEVDHTLIDALLCSILRDHFGWK